MLKLHALRMREWTQHGRQSIHTSIARGRRRLKQAGRRLGQAYQRLRQPATLPALYAAIDQQHYARWQHWQIYLDAKEAQLEHQRSPVDVEI